MKRYQLSFCLYIFKTDCLKAWNLVYLLRNAQMQHTKRFKYSNYHFKMVAEQTSYMTPLFNNTRNKELIIQNNLCLKKSITQYRMFFMFFVYWFIYFNSRNCYHILPMPQLFLLRLLNICLAEQTQHANFKHCYQQLNQFSSIF